MQGRNRDTDIVYRVMDPVGAGEDGTIGESSFEIYTSPYAKERASGMLLNNTGSSAWSSETN